MKNLFIFSIFTLIMSSNVYSSQSQQVQEQRQECTQQTPCSALDRLERNSNLQKRQGENQYDFQSRVLADVVGEDEQYQEESSEEFRRRVIGGLQNMQQHQNHQSQQY